MKAMSVVSKAENPFAENIFDENSLFEQPTL